MYYYERVVNFENETHYIRNVHNDISTQNMAIISNERAKEVLFFLPHSNYPDRVDTNRPLLGIRLNNYVVLSAHSDPKPSRSEINLSVQKVAHFMDSECHQTRWILMGDTNLEPDFVHVPRDTQTCFYSKVIPNTVTKPPTDRSGGPGRIIDYGIYGGPLNWQGHLAAQTQLDRFGSDHFPVIIGPPTVHLYG